MPTSEPLPTEAAVPRKTRSRKGRFVRNGTRPNVTLTVTHRQQSPQEARQFTTALSLFLSELVRQELSRRDGVSDEKRTH